MSQETRLYSLLADGLPHRTDEIVEVVYGPGCALARVGARIHNLKRKGYEITGWKDHENPALYWYQLKPEWSGKGIQQELVA